MMKYFFCIIFLISFVNASVKNKDVINKLKQNIERLEKSIVITKEKVKSPKEVEFLPDIFLSLAELYIEKARFMYALKLEEKSGTPIEEIDFTAEKRVKQEAIDTLQSLLDRYSKYNSRDRVLFAIGHEYREINDSNKAMRYFKEITEKYPDSAFWAESQYILGMIFFEKKDYEFAKQQFEKVMQKKENIFEAQALYKIGQCEIFLDKYLSSLIFFEKALAVKKNAPDKGGAVEKDIREEVLIASVVPLTDLTDQELAGNPRFLNAIEYYKEMSYDQASYRRVLQRLARRLSVKTKSFDAAKVFYELMRLSVDPQSKREAFESYYLSMKQSKKDFFPETLQTDLQDTFSLLRLNEIDYKKYEAAYRDIATKFHTNSNAVNRIEDFNTASLIYEDYLSFFPKSKYAKDMKVNIAESYFKAEKYIESAKYYSEIAKNIKVKGKANEFYLSALQALEKSFEVSNDLSALERFQSRYKYRQIAADFLKTNRELKEAVRVSFNVAKTYYDEKAYQQAVVSLRNFVIRYPNESQASEAVLLLLDTYYVRDDLKGLVKEGNSLLSKVQFAAQTKSKIQDVLQQAQLKNVKSIAGDFGSKKYAENIIQFAKSNKNSALGENALFEAFSALKSQNDEKTYEVGEDYLASFPKSPKVKEVLLTMTQMALVSVDIKRAQRFLTAFAQKFPDDNQKLSYLQQAAAIAEQSGDLRESARLYKEVGNIEKQVQVLFYDSNWAELQSVAARISGVRGIYYTGLAMYRMGKRDDGLNLFRRLQNMSAGDYESKNQIAHAGYIVAYEESKNFQSVGGAMSFTPAVLKQKIQNFQEVDKQIQNVIKQGVGRWALAALYLEGRLNNEMVRYLSSVPVPQGMSSDQLSKILAPQISKFKNNANNIFSQCILTGEENDIFTSFVEGCRSQGKISVTEEKDIQKNFKSSQRGIASESNSQIRKQIYKNPRSVAAIHPLVKSYVAQGDYSSALLTLNRLQEIEPQNLTWKAEMGVVSMYMNNLDEAFGYFQEAYSKDSNNRTAVWGLKSLYKKFNYAKKSGLFIAKAKSLGRPDGLAHPWMEL